MKKIKLITLLISILFFTGCNKDKKIECSYNDKNNPNIDYNYILEFDKSSNFLKKIELSLKKHFSSETDLNNYLNTLNNNDICNYIIDNNYSDIRNLIICNSEKNLNILEINIQYNYDKFTSEQKNNFLGNLTFAEFKKKYKTNSDETVCEFDSNQKLQPLLYQDNIINAVEDANKVSVEQSVTAIIESAQNYMIMYMLDSYGVWNDSIIFACDGQTCSANINDEKVDLEFSGMVPTSGEIVLDQNGNAEIKDAIILKGYTCILDNNSNVQCTK